MDSLISSKDIYIVRCLIFTNQYVLLISSLVAPNGIVYVKPEVRISLLARMLKELLETRIMIKTAMKSAKGDKVS
jgi:hypothetical protein